MRSYESWGRVPRVAPARVRRAEWRSELPTLELGPAPVLPYGRGRSYGDSCLNDGGVLIDTRGLDRLVDFDAERGVVRCEAGVGLDDLLEVIVPRGWFLPVSPGTKFVTVAGAVANDIHGKNHHVAGTFGRHVRRFELHRSDGTRRECAPDENPGLFRATIGGLGLTGLISWVEFELKRVPGPWLALEQIRFRSFDEYLALESESGGAFEYTVAWLDCLSGGPGRGLFQRANFAPGPPRPPRRPPRLRPPFDLPAFLLNPVTMRLFNWAIYHSQVRDRAERRVHYDPFFYPLDLVHDWNRLYGRPGFFQYQFVVPLDGDAGVFWEILERVRASRRASFLVVLKKFGNLPSPGLLSFPRPGLTLALDFPNRGASTRALLDELDRIVGDAGGAVYPAKDARMSPESFQRYFPQWKEFTRYVDPNFSSTFWRRVTAGARG